MTNQKKNNETAKKVAYYSVLIALAMIISYIEILLPFNFGIPGVKLGLANVVVLVALYLLGTKDAFYISIIRILLIGFTFAGLGTMLYSLTGGLLSFLVMALVKKSNRFSILGVSVLGSIFHNIGQVSAASLIVQNLKVMSYALVLTIVGIVTGVLIGIISNMVIKHMPHVKFE